LILKLRNFKPALRASTDVHRTCGECQPDFLRSTERLAGNERRTDMTGCKGPEPIRRAGKRSGRDVHERKLTVRRSKPLFSGGRCASCDSEILRDDMPAARVVDRSCQLKSRTAAQHDRERARHTSATQPQAQRRCLRCGCRPTCRHRESRDKNLKHPSDLHSFKALRVLIERSLRNSYCLREVGASDARAARFCSARCPRGPEIPGMCASSRVVVGVT